MLLVPQNVTSGTEPGMSTAWIQGWLQIDFKSDLHTRQISGNRNKEYN